MISIALLLTEPGRISLEVGHVDFYVVPVQKNDDFVCRPPGLLSLEDAKTVSTELVPQAVKGRIGRYDWRRDN